MALRGDVASDNTKFELTGRGFQRCISMKKVGLGSLVSLDIVQKGANLFGLNIDKLHFIGGIDGSVYESENKNKAYILKFKNVSKNGIEAVRAELDFISYLGNNGVDVTMPLPSLSGKLLEVIDENDSIYAVTAFDKALGRYVNFDDESEWNSGLFYRWGRINGQIHALSKKYIDKYERSNWYNQFEGIAKSCPDGIILEKWVNIKKNMSNLPKDQEAYGLIHNDMHPWNFFVLDNRLTVFDFGDCIHHWFVNDIAIALYWAVWAGPADKRHSGEEFVKVFIQSFMKGYSSENILDGRWLKQLPLFLKHRQILLYIFFTYKFKGDADVKNFLLKDAEYGILNDLPVVNMDF